VLAFLDIVTEQSNQWTLICGQIVATNKQRVIVTEEQTNKHKDYRDRRTNKHKDHTDRRTDKQT